MENNLKTAQELISTSNVYVSCGFNQFIHGDKSPIRSDYGNAEQWHAELQGYDYARKMAETDGIAFTHIFKCGQSERCFPFNYGGLFVCNTCGLKSVDKDWWKIQVEKDGDQFCCHGLDFVNLQESENYAFGSTFNQAIENYGILMLSKKIK